MKQLIEFIPLILFFVVYKLFGTQEAAIVLVVATLVQLVVLKKLYGKIEKMQIFSKNHRFSVKNAAIYRRFCGCFWWINRLF